MDDFLGMSIEVTDQNNEGVFSSLSRNFDQTVEEINSADEESTTSSSSDSSNNANEESTTSSSSDSSNNANEESTASDVPVAAFESSNLINSNSTTADNLGINNRTDFNR